MTIYVDDMYRYPMGQFGRMKMSHMIGDTPEELHKFARLLGLRRDWYQGDHYDISMSVRERAIGLGAVAITLKQLACMNSLRLAGYEMGDPATAVERRAALSREP
jgi:hypothetical protein